VTSVLPEHLLGYITKAAVGSRCSRLVVLAGQAGLQGGDRRAVRRAIRVEAEDVAKLLVGEAVSAHAGPRSCAKLTVHSHIEPPAPAITRSEPGHTYGRRGGQVVPAGPSTHAGFACLAADLPYG
jgi:hypothetical protein